MVSTWQYTKRELRKLIGRRNLLLARPSRLAEAVSIRNPGMSPSGIRRVLWEARERRLVAFGHRPLLIMTCFLILSLSMCLHYITYNGYGLSSFMYNVGVISGLLFGLALPPLFFVMEIWSETRQFLFGRISGITPILPIIDATKIAPTCDMTVDAAISELCAPDVHATENTLLHAGFSHGDLLRVADMMLSTRDIGQYRGMFMPSVRAEKIAARVLSALRPQVVAPALDVEVHDSLMSFLLAKDMPVHIDTYAVKQRYVPDAAQEQA